MEYKDKEYNTSDLALAALLSLSFPIEKVVPISTSKVSFLFSHTAELKMLVDKYLQRKTIVEPQTYFAQIKWVKTQVYSVLRGDLL